MTQRSRNHPPTTQHNHQQKLKKLLAVKPPPPGKVYESRVMHDDWCDLLNGKGFCNCDPDITTTELP